MCPLLVHTAGRYYCCTHVFKWSFGFSSSCLKPSEASKALRLMYNPSSLLISIFWRLRAFRTGGVRSFGWLVIYNCVVESALLVEESYTLIDYIYRMNGLPRFLSKKCPTLDISLSINKRRSACHFDFVEKISGFYVSWCLKLHPNYF